MNESVRPIFLLSLPRSGSTLLQRIIAGGEEVYTVSEPWILLPFFYSRRVEGVYAEYGHAMACRGIREFLDRSGDAGLLYRSLVRDFAISLYSSVAPSEAIYFLDKTPRYSLIAQELFEVFPDAKFVFLWRNPLAIVASIVKRWSGGRWFLCPNTIDLFEGLANLVSAFIGNSERVVAIRYEDLVTHPDVELGRLSEYLSVAVDTASIRPPSSVDLTGTWGDKATLDIPQISSRPVSEWKTEIGNPLRKWWCKRYVEWIGESRLEIMGYTKRAILEDVRLAPMGRMRSMPIDLLSLAYSWTQCSLATNVVYSGLRRNIAYRRSYKLG